MIIGTFLQDAKLEKICKISSEDFPENSFNGRHSKESKVIPFFILQDNFGYKQRPPLWMIHISYFIALFF